MRAAKQYADHIGFTGKLESFRLPNRDCVLVTYDGGELCTMSALYIIRQGEFHSVDTIIRSLYAYEDKWKRTLSEVHS